MKFRLDQVRISWNLWRKFQFFMWSLVCLIISLTRDMNEFQNQFEVLGGVLHLIFYLFIHPYVMKNDFFARYIGVFLMWTFEVYMTEVNILSSSHRVYEGFLIMISLECWFTTLLVVDILLSPIVVFITHTYIIIRFHMTFEHIPDIIYPAMYCPVIYLLFTWYLLNNHIKKDFLSREVQRNLIERFYHIFRAFPERIVISKRRKDEEAEYPFSNDEKLSDILENKARNTIEDIVRL